MEVEVEVERTGGGEDATVETPLVVPEMTVELETLGDGGANNLDAGLLGGVLVPVDTAPLTALDFVCLELDQASRMESRIPIQSVLSPTNSLLSGSR